MTQASSTRFLIVGAGGSHGATGNHVARQLLARGMPVRAFVRQADERADELRELGAGYTNCAPTPEARLLQSLRTQAAEARKLLG